MYWMRRLVFAGVLSLFGGVGVPALAVEISGSAGGVSYRVIGSGSVSAAPSEDGTGVDIGLNGVTIIARATEILVAETVFPVAPYGTVTVENTGTAIEVRTDETVLVSLNIAEQLEIQAAAGDMVAANALAVMLFEGDGVAPDPDRAQTLMLAAAEAGLPQAQGNVAARYYQGNGFPQNDQLARRWAVAAADRGNVIGLQIAGRMLLFGEGNAADPTAAIPYLEAAVAEGSAWASANLGYAYGTGTGVQADIERAAELYLAGIDGGIGWAGANLAVIAIDTDGAVVNFEDGLAFLDRAGALGSEDLDDIRTALLAKLAGPSISYFFVEDGSPVGPLTLDELFAEKDAGRITSATLIWQEGTPDWIRADAHPVFDN